MGRKLVGLVATLVALGVIVGSTATTLRGDTSSPARDLSSQDLAVETQDRGGVPRFHRPDCFVTVSETPLPQEAPRVVQGREPLQISLSAGDTVYVSHPADAAPEPGGLFRIARDAGTIRHPATGEEVGIARSYRGVGEVVELGDGRTRIRILSSCREIEAGDRLIRRAEFELPEVGELPDFEPGRLIDPRPEDGTVLIGSLVSVPAPAGDPATMTRVDQQGHSVGDVLAVDRGTADGWRRADLVVLYRPAQEYLAAEVDAGIPQIVGRAFVFLTEETTSTLLITDAVEPVAVGDRARRIAGR